MRLWTERGQSLRAALDGRYSQRLHHLLQLKKRGKGSGSDPPASDTCLWLWLGSSRLRQEKWCPGVVPGLSSPVSRGWWRWSSSSLSLLSLSVGPESVWLPEVEKRSSWSDCSFNKFQKLESLGRGGWRQQGSRCRRSPMQRGQQKTRWRGM